MTDRDAHIGRLRALAESLFRPGSDWKAGARSLIVEIETLDPGFIARMEAKSIIKRLGLPALQNDVCAGSGWGRSLQ